MKLGFLFLCAYVVNAQRMVKLGLQRKPRHILPKIGLNSTLQGPVPLGGDFGKDGEYFVGVTVGGFPLDLLVDTGSSDVGMSSVGCNGCTKKENAPYDPLKSRTAVPLNCTWCEEHTTKSSSISCQDRPNVGDICTMRISYADDSGFSAALYSDTFSFGSSSAVSTVVGAMYEAKFPNPKQIDGIVGFASKSESSSNSLTPFDQLVAAKQVDDIFSLCLHREGGQLYLGSDSTEEQEAAVGLFGLGESTIW